MVKYVGNLLRYVEKFGPCTVGGNVNCGEPMESPQEL